MPHSLRRPLKRLGYYLLIILILCLPACEVKFTPDIPPIEYQTIETPSGFGEIEPVFQSPLVTEVNQTDLSVFFSQYEFDERIPNDVLERYLTNPEIMAVQIALIQDFIDNLESGSAPLRPMDFYEMALDQTGDPGTALLVCHNVLKAMSRGLSPIPWESVTRNPLVYRLDGKEIEIDTTQIHPDAQLIGSWGQTSVFYLIFSPYELGTDDEGDWYHYFLEATVAYYTASGRFSLDVPEFEFSYSNFLGPIVEDTIQQLYDPDIPESDPYRAWRWANALSFLEEAEFGTDHDGTQEEAVRESRIHMRGAIMGLELAGYPPEWDWYIAEIGTANLLGVDVSSSTYEKVSPLEETNGGNP
jgi:hypothetical protein